MDKSRSSLLVSFSLIVALSMAVIYLVTQNSKLIETNRALVSSRDSLRAKAQKLREKNRELFKILAKNSHLVENALGQKKSLQETIQALRKEEEAIQFEMKKSQAQMNTALEEKIYLEDMLIHKTRQIESLKNQAPAAATGTAASSADTTSNSDINVRIKEKEQEISRLTEQNQALSLKMDRLYQVTTSKISEINVAKIALEDTVSGAKDKIDQEWNTVNLGSISIDKKEPATAAGAPQPVRSGPKTAGKVLAINENHGFVVVDLGKVDNLNTSANLEIVRDGKNIASLSILEIREAMAACNIKFLENGEKIRINDAVQITGPRPPGTR